MQRRVSSKKQVLLYLIPAFCMGINTPTYWARGNLLAAGLSGTGALVMVIHIIWTLATQGTAKRQSDNAAESERNTPE